MALVIISFVLHPIQFVQDWQTSKLPATIHSKRVPTEYDVQTQRLGITLRDDRNRKFRGLTLKIAFRKAEKAQNPADPIHHPPYPHPADVPMP